MSIRLRPLLLLHARRLGRTAAHRRQRDRDGAHAQVAQLMTRSPHAHLDASKRHFGLPDGQMGDSEEERGRVHVLGLM
jgi:bisphosphoglycerate-independent phosphoglycerate mutase (AlkP superfamily)